MTVNKEISHRVIHRLICATRSRVRSKIGSLQRNRTFEWSLFRGKLQEGGKAQTKNDLHGQVIRSLIEA